MVLIALVTGFARQAFAAPDSISEDPSAYLQCDGSPYSVGEPLYAADSADVSAASLSPAQIAGDIVAARPVQAGQKALTSQRTLFQSATRSDIGFAAEDARTTMVVSMDNHSQAGWRVRAIYECA